MTGAIYLVIVLMMVKYSLKAVKYFAEKKKTLEDSRVNKGIGGYNGSSSVSSIEEDFFGVATVMIPIFSILVAVFLMIFAIDCFKLGIKMVINPDYYAFQDVMKLLCK